MRLLVIAALAALVFLGPVAHAVDTPIEGTAIELQDIENIIQDIANFFLTVAGLIAVGFMVYGGLQMVTSGGNDAKFGEGKKTLTNAIIGALVIFAVGLIINTIAKFAGNPTGFF